jgi:hypothetical protein
VSGEKRSSTPPVKPTATAPDNLVQRMQAVQTRAGNALRDDKKLQVAY